MSIPMKIKLKVGNHSIGGPIAKVALIYGIWRMSRTPRSARRDARGVNRASSKDPFNDRPSRLVPKKLARRVGKQPMRVVTYINLLREAKDNEALATVIEPEVGRIRDALQEAVGSDQSREVLYGRCCAKLLIAHVMGFGASVGELGNAQAIWLLAHGASHWNKDLGYLWLSLRSVSMGIGSVSKEIAADLALNLQQQRSPVDVAQRRNATLALNLLGSLPVAEGARTLSAFAPIVSQLVVETAKRPDERSAKVFLVATAMLRDGSLDRAEVVSAWGEAYGAFFAKATDPSDDGTDADDLGRINAALLLCLELMGRPSRSGNTWDGVVVAAARLLERCIADQPRSCTHLSAAQMDRLRRERPGLRPVPPAHRYYSVVAPWLQVTCLRVLRAAPPPLPAAATSDGVLFDVLGALCAAAGAQPSAPKGGSQNLAHALFAVALEAVPLCLRADVAAAECAPVAPLEKGGAQSVAALSASRLVHEVVKDQHKPAAKNFVAVFQRLFVEGALPPLAQGAGAPATVVDWVAATGWWTSIKWSPAELAATPPAVEVAATPPPVMGVAVVTPSEVTPVVSAPAGGGPGAAGASAAVAEEEEAALVEANARLMSENAALRARLEALEKKRAPPLAAAAAAAATSSTAASSSVSPGAEEPEKEEEETSALFAEGSVRSDADEGELVDSARDDPPLGQAKGGASLGASTRYASFDATAEAPPQPPSETFVDPFV